MKQIKISDETHDKLWKFKRELHYDSLDSAIDFLLFKYKEVTEK